MINKSVKRDYSQYDESLVYLMWDFFFTKHNFYFHHSAIDLAGKTYWVSIYSLYFSLVLEIFIIRTHYLILKFSSLKSPVHYRREITISKSPCFV